MRGVGTAGSNLGMATTHPAELRDAESVVHGSRYLVLATATLGGAPWATPVYFAISDPWTFWWVSAPGTRHSRNVAANPQVALTVFDSTVELGAAAAVYAEAGAEQCPAADLAAGIAVFSARSVGHGGDRWDEARVTGSARLRLYRARASTVDVLSRDEGPDRRLRAWAAASATTPRS
jgi:pyridoxamine 5'-phosphate oxidase-like protein